MTIDWSVVDIHQGRVTLALEFASLQRLAQACEASGLVIYGGSSDAIKVFDLPDQWGDDPDLARTYELMASFFETIGYLAWLQQERAILPPSLEAWRAERSIHVDRLARWQDATQDDATTTPPTPAAPQQDTPTPQRRYPPDVDGADLESFIAEVQTLTPEQRAEILRQMQAQQMAPKPGPERTALLVSNEHDGYVPVATDTLNIVKSLHQLPTEEQQRLLTDLDRQIWALMPAAAPEREQQAS